jgi:tetratricopeptide (TPR) repeat protein
MKRLSLAVVVLVVLVALGYASLANKPTTPGRLAAAERFLEQDRYAAAEREIDAAIAASPRQFATYSSVVQMLLANGRFTEAAEYAGFTLNGATAPRYLARKLSSRERLTMLLALGGARYECGDLPAAIAAYEEALPLDLHNPQILNALGYSYAEAGLELHRALSLTKQAVRLAPDSAEIVDSLGWTYYKLGRYEEAEKHLKQAVALSPDLPELRYHLGVLYARWGLPVKARIELSKAIILDSNLDSAKRELRMLD